MMTTGVNVVIAANKNAEQEQISADANNKNKNKTSAHHEKMTKTEQEVDPPERTRSGPFSNENEKFSPRINKRKSLWKNKSKRNGSAENKSDSKQEQAPPSPQSPIADVNVNLLEYHLFDVTMVSLNVARQF